MTAEGIRFYDSSVIPWIRRRVDVIHSEGAACFAQVFHPGAGRHAVRLAPPVAPSPVSDPYVSSVPHPLDEAEIHGAVVAFAHGIRRTQEAGADAPEVHGAHGYLVHQFLSPYFNRRQDGWGGTPERRVQFAIHIVESARQLVGGSFPIGIRIGVDGSDARGLDVAQLVDVARLLEPHFDYISVSGGNYAGFGKGSELAYVSPWYKEPAYNWGSAAAVKASVSVPVFVTGRIADPSLAETILSEGAADMVGMVRALIADPELPAKAIDGRTDAIRMCIGLSECHHLGASRVPVTCAINASAGRESEMAVTRATVAKTVAIVGSGPAGMEAARIAATRGHRVYLADRANAIGGTVRLLSADPNRRNLKDLIACFEHHLRGLGVELLLGNDVSAEELVAFAPDAAALATGGVPAIPPVPGIASENVLTAVEVLAGSKPVAPDARILVVGGLDPDIGGPTIAEFLADQGHEVEFISEHVDFAPAAEAGTRLMLLHRLMQKRVVVTPCSELVEIDGGQAHVRQTFSGQRRDLGPTTVVLACGSVPDDQLQHELRGRILEIHVIGDALAPRRIMHATIEGSASRPLAVALLTSATRSQLRVPGCGAENTDDDPALHDLRVELVDALAESFDCRT